MSAMTLLAIRGYVDAERAKGKHASTAIAIPLTLAEWEAILRDGQDAARYRWLRKHYRPDVEHRLTWYLPRWVPPDAAGLDSSIDSNLEYEEAQSTRNEYGGLGVGREGTDV